VEQGWEENKIHAAERKSPSGENQDMQSYVHIYEVIAQGGGNTAK
jgi:hypothetical protein